MARLSKSRAIQILRKQQDAITGIDGVQFDSPAFKKWRRDTEIIITNIFGTDSRHINDFKSVDYIGTISIFYPKSDREAREDYLSGLECAQAVLDSMINEIDEFWEDESSGIRYPSTRSGTLLNTREVFVIHGRDNGARQMVARFLEKMDLTPVILDEESNQGQTIIEKFEKHAAVRFALALLTPDDIGSLCGEENNLKPRARQNVIFEFGYFIGRLGREHVCALTKGNVEIPTDYAGVLYIPLDDDGGWKMRLVKEFKNCGLDVDANKAL